MRIAHKTLPFGTWVRIRNVSNGREAVAMVDDRGPFHGGRVIDATPAVAERPGFLRQRDGTGESDGRTGYGAERRAAGCRAGR